MVSVYGHVGELIPRGRGVKDILGKDGGSHGQFQFARAGRSRCPKRPDCSAALGRRSRLQATSLVTGTAISGEC